MHGVRSILIALVLVAGAAHGATTVEDIRVWSENGRTRVVLDLSRPAQHNIFTLRSPDRLVIDLKDGRLAGSLSSTQDGRGAVRTIRTGLRADGQLRVVLDLNESVRSRSFTAGPNGTYGDRLVVDLQRQGPVHAVKRASDVYDEGRDIVVAVDPGHGGHDPGAIGRGRTKEKDVALAVSRLLAARINAEPGMRAVLVRTGDYYVDHRERMEIARRNKADLFVSVHADAVGDRRAQGASVYALSLKGASDEAAKRLAQRENAAVLVGGVSLAGKDQVLASVLLDLSQNAALSASLNVGDKVIRELARIGDVHRRKVQQAGFLVLKSPDVPSILVETAYISNPEEERKLTSSAHQSRIANAILGGIRNYFYANPPPDTQIAMNLKQSPDQQVNYVISRGDTLSEIAARYNVSMSAIKAANKMRGNQVRIGQKLLIPVYAGS
ncbi:MAG TPA: N-acetylmuramoyl-L-alanine amidase [Woeseiaceae bacterium]|nr:N-acetylmuramoyl-L-alanine amidase [Woeseiaceae bacterium]